MPIIPSTGGSILGADGLQRTIVNAGAPAANAYAG